MSRRIAIVEDEPAIRANYAEALRKHGFEVAAYAARGEALAAMRTRLPDLALIDIALGADVDGGFALCRELRALSAALPIIFLTARDSDFDTVVGLRLGADDYLTKDVSLPHLMARIAALFRRAELSGEVAAVAERLERGPLALDLKRFSVTWKGNPVTLTLTEFWMVHALAKFPEHVKTREQLMRDANLVVDDGTIADRRGSLNVDDEGTTTNCTTLIEDGILVGYMQDTLNARLMGMQPTGNGRRESFAHLPMPRMTNTYMLAGQHHPEEIIRSVKKGLYAVNFGGGQVDITSGKFVFSANEAYLIEDGRIGAPVKGATLIGNGPEAMTRVSMIGNDLALDAGVGVCGKEGQSLPVGVGQPTLRIDALTVGGTRA